MSIRNPIPWHHLLLLITSLVLLAGCVTTGRGDFPVFPDRNRSGQTLAVIPPVGPDADRVSTSVLYHLNRRRLENTFRSVDVLGTKSVQPMLKDVASLTELSDEDARTLRNTVNADWVLVFLVHELNVESFSTTETERIERTNTRYRNTQIQGDKKGKDGSISTRETRYSVTEIPVEEGNIRAILSMSAEIYDLENDRVLWSGRRIERAQDELKDLSAVELVDIVVERIMYRVVSRLTA